MRRRDLLRRAGLAAAGTLAGRPGHAALPQGPPSPVSPDSGSEPGPLPALRRSDVVFMYEAKAPVYAEYGATVLAWGGTPTPESLGEAAGVAFHGSVGMVTEFASYRRRFPRGWEDGLVRDLDGRPVKVPWLTDHQHEGVPYWWCCTRQPRFREYLEERVAGTVRAGAVGVHLDDHLGTAGSLFLETCFCDRCVDGFRAHLAGLERSALAALGVADATDFDFRAAARSWRAAAPPGTARRLEDHPLWREWSTCHLRSAAAWMKDLRALAARSAGRAVPISANAGLLWPNHLADYQAVDYFSAEIDHEAASRGWSDRSLFACRLAEAMGRPLAATASGQDWAFVKELGLSGLVRGWIAASYAAGQMLMAPHRQWCHTEEKGTHWYDGPSAAYAPLYRFVREQQALLDGHETHAEVALVMPHASYVAERDRWLDWGRRLAAANVGYRLVVGGDAVVDRAIAARELAGVQAVVSPRPMSLQERDRATVAAARSRVPLVATVEEAIGAVRPAVLVEGAAPVRVLPRVGAEGAVVHVLNRAYDESADAVRPLEAVGLRLDLGALGVAGARTARLVRPGAEPRDVPVTAEGRLRFDLTDGWTLVAVRRG